MTRRGLFAAIPLLLATALSGCSRGESASSPRVLNGAGATLPSPLYARWSTEYAKLDPAVRINYQPVGSGAGVRQVTDGVVDFGATDEPLTEAEAARARGAVLHVPMTVGAVAITYNAPERGATSEPIRFPADVIADVFLGVVTRWDDARLRAANPGRPLPAEPITVVHRADGSGTSAAFSGWLSRSSEGWRVKVGTGTTLRFPVGVGVRGNEGVAAYVKQTPFTIGYLEVAHARIAGLPVASIQNRAGAFVAPTNEAIERAVRAAELVPESSAADGGALRETDGEAYPILALSYVVVPRDARDRARGLAVARFLWWAVHEGQRFAKPLDYAELPPALVLRAEGALREMRGEGRVLLPAGT